MTNTTLGRVAYEEAKRRATVAMTQRLLNDTVPANQCNDCGGTGASADERYIVCRVCVGTGHFDHTREMYSLFLREMFCTCVRRPARQVRQAPDGRAHFGRDVTVCMQCLMVVALVREHT